MTRWVVAAALAAACAGAAAAAPLTGAGAPPAGSPSVAAGDKGQAMFVEKCGMCHRARGMGTFLLQRRMPVEQAQLEARTDLEADYVVQVARVGLGNMPAIPRGEVSDRQLEEIAAYLARKPAP